MNSKERSKCKKIIYTATAACAGIGGGLAQLPGSDAIPISAAQVTMVIGLGKVFGKAVTESAARAVITGMAGAAFGRFVSQCLVGWVPGLGNWLNATTAGVITERLGWMVAKKFDRERG